MTPDQRKSFKGYNRPSVQKFYETTQSPSFKGLSPDAQADVGDHAAMQLADESLHLNQAEQKRVHEMHSERKEKEKIIMARMDRITMRAQARSAKRLGQKDDGDDGEDYMDRLTNNVKSPPSKAPPTNESKYMR